jgi:ribosomal protein S6E (S10)
MEEIIPMLKDMLKKAIEIDFEESKLSISLKIKSHIKGNLADPNEVIVMLKIFGGMKETIPMDISINNESKTITIMLHNQESYLELTSTLKDIWDNAVNMLNSVLNGDLTYIKDIPNVDDSS